MGLTPSHSSGTDFLPQQIHTIPLRRRENRGYDEQPFDQYKCQNNVQQNGEENNLECGICDTPSLKDVDTISGCHDKPGKDSLSPPLLSNCNNSNPLDPPFLQESSSQKGFWDDFDLDFDDHPESITQQNSLYQSNATASSNHGERENSHQQENELCSKKNFSKVRLLHPQLSPSPSMPTGAAKSNQSVSVNDPKWSRPFPWDIQADQINREIFGNNSFREQQVSEKIFYKKS